ncbi:Transcription initiation factor TFIID, subunit TAF1, partial [Pseudoloma neurophilia]
TFRIIQNLKILNFKAEKALFLNFFKTMKKEFNPLDLLCTPRPLSYKLLSIKHNVKGELYQYTDYSTRTKRNLPEQYRNTKRIRKRHFEKEVYAQWEKDSEKQKVTEIEEKQTIESIDQESDQFSLENYDVKKDRRFKQGPSVKEPILQDTNTFTYTDEYFDTLGQPVNYVNWEDDIVYDTEHQPEITELGLNDRSNVCKQFITSVFNTTLWEEDIIYDNIKNFNTNTQIWLNDSNLIFSPILNKPQNHSYNISLDKFYNEIKRNKETLGITHSLIGSKMEWPNENSVTFLDTYVNQRNGTIFKNERISSQKEKVIDQQIINLTPSSLISAVTNLITLKDHTLSDRNKVTITEYAEECPIIKQEMGMGSLLVEYEVFEDNKTENELIPENEEAKQLPLKIKLNLNNGSLSEEPFCVKLRENTLCLINNLFKARAYKHKNDGFFLLIFKQEDNCKIKSPDMDKIKGIFNQKIETSIFIREIDELYCIGQTFPSEEVFSPHSRKLNIFCKNRLKQFCFKKINEKKQSYSSRFMVSLNEIDKEFPHFTDGSKKKWLKEYSDLVRENNQTFYKLKGMMDENEIDNLVNAEQMCLYKSMTNFIQFEQNRLLESPWTISKNYLLFKKKSIGIEIENDYTGRGEGISFKQGEVTEVPYEIWEREKDALSREDIVPDDLDKQSMVLPERSFIEQQDNQNHPEPNGNRPYMVITRIIDGEKVVETVYNQAVIDLYLRERENMKEKRAKQQSVLRCGACNEIGHMKTNKTCPLFVSKRKKPSKQKKAKNLLNSIIASVLSKCINLHFSSAFTKPVNVKKFPDYPKIVKEPIDLGIMKSRSKTNMYMTFNQFEENLNLMRMNCVLYNGESHGLSILAGKMVNLAKEARETRGTEIEDLEREIIEEINKTESFDKIEPSQEKQTTENNESHTKISEEGTNFQMTDENQKSDELSNFENELEREMDDV